MTTGLIRPVFGAMFALATIALAAGCDSPLLDLGETITLAADIDENRRPLGTRERFSLEDESIYVQVAIPPETAGPEQRDFHFEFFDGEGRIVSANGATVTRTRADWRVGSMHRINPEIDAPGLWRLEVYVDGGHIGHASFPVTAAADDPLPDAPVSAGPPPGCCAGPGSPVYQIFFATGVDEELDLLRGRRDRFRFADGRMYVYLRMTNIPNGAHELQYTFYQGDGSRLSRYAYSFESTRRRWLAWAWVDLTLQRDSPGLWTVDIHLDGKLIGSVRVPVDA